MSNGEKILAARLADDKGGDPFWFVALSSAPESFLEVNKDPRGASLENVRKLFAVHVSKDGKTRTLTMRIARRFLALRGAEFLE